MLLREGADPNAKSGPKGDTALHVAARANLSLLLDAGAAVDARNNLGETPLMHVSSGAAAFFLLDRGAAFPPRLLLAISKGVPFLTRLPGKLRWTIKTLRG